MTTDSTNDQNNQSATRIIEANAQLSAGEKAALLKIFHDVKHSLAEAEAQLKQTREEESAKAVFLENVLADLREKAKTVEAQNQEFRIEAALERVRSRTLSMQNSRDVGNAIGLLFAELEGLGIVTLRCGIFVIEEETKTMEVWTATSTPDGKVGKVSGRFSVTIHPMLVNAFNAWKEGEAFYTYELAGDELVDYFKILLAANPGYALPVQSLKADRQISSGFFFNEGAVFTFTKDPHPPPAIAVMKRFAAVFGHTYRRYLDLRTAEEQARRSARQASIDRLRAEIASMRNSNDLRRITPLLWQELTALQVRFTRCGVFIMNEQENVIQAYLSTPQGRPRGVLTLPVVPNEHTGLLFSNWKDQTVYTNTWTKEQLILWLAQVAPLNQGGNTADLQSEEDLPETLFFHFIPFAQGMIYVGYTESLTEDEVEVVKSLADAFSIAYSRYEDFKGLEEAKNKLEITLHELRAAQRQLIQSEKMASLGELTAGIAHEIQNPLNFINNFAEVCTELLVEVKESLQKDDGKQAMAAVADMEENLKKINHHGKRAESIVRGMLLHSRTSGGEKLPTDINVLADEYLRLSYHGLRAKDTLFNAKIITNFDPSVGKLIVAPQDIGRALLNLFNNAFYAVNEKKKSVGNAFGPTVSVDTKRVGDDVEISVGDNGTGMPPSVAEKIFQPFFTTKPTGQGTGLGLSLSYDIVKAHGGELTVETKEGQGTMFKIILPAKTN